MREIIKFKDKHIVQYKYHKALPYTIEIDGEDYTAEECAELYPNEIEVLEFD